MTNTEFSYMKEQVINALNTNDDNAPIWYEGHFWIRLTNRQATKLITILMDSDLARNEKYIYLPSGLGIALEQ